MLEHEAKILNVDENEIQKKLESLGAKKILDDVTYIEGYDFDPAADLDSIDVPEKFRSIIENIDHLRNSRDMFSQGAYLRLRQEGNQFELIFKQKVEGINGIKSEIEISIPILRKEWASTTRLLVSLGLRQVALQEKRRVSYIYPPYRFDIDTWPGVPTYLEVEAPSREEVLQAIALLGFSQESAMSMSAAEVFELYGIDNPRHLVFGEVK
jgi:adenylate cyclase class IV